MKRSSLLAAVAILLLAAPAFAAENPRHLREQGNTPFRLAAAPNVYALVLDPDGRPAAAAPGEALQYVVTRESARQNVIYAFTSSEGRDAFIARHEAAAETKPMLEKVCANARFNKVAYGTGIDWLNMACGQTNAFLSNSWNDVISYAEASGSWTMLFKCYNFNRAPYNPNNNCSTLTIEGGTTIYDFHPIGFNDITSSIKVCPQGISFSDCQNYF
jgi:hypothetical protein